jgi:hypothetical protein
MDRNLKVLLVLSAGLLAAGAVSGQQETRQSGKNTAELHQARVLLKFGREDIVKEEMRFSEAEAEAFWPVYDRYEADLLVIRDRYADLVTGYTAAYRAGTVSEDQAEQIVDDYLDIQEQLLRVKRKYLGDFRKAIPARKAARFYQLENKMEVELEFQLAQVIPLIDPV